MLQKHKTIIYLLSLVLFSFFIGNAQQGSKGNIYVFSGGEVGLFGNHDFQENIDNITNQGIIGTDRDGIQGHGSIAFTNGAFWINASNNAMVDGYVKTYITSGFTFPVGDNGLFYPAAVSKSGVESTEAAYYAVDPSVSITSDLKGGNYGVLPSTGPFNTENFSDDLISVDASGYWDINGSIAAKVTLTWREDKQIGTLTGDDLDKLTIVGWNGEQWEVVGSSVDTTSLSTNTGALLFNGIESSLTIGSITTNEEIVPSLYEVYTLGKLCCDTRYNISGVVFDDDNENGSIDSAEAGRLENITLTLYADNDNNGRVGAGDTVISTTTSAADGTYSFADVTVQNTLVVVTVPDNDSDYNYTLTTSERKVTSSTTTDVTGADFGINQESTSYTISGNVFNDTNGDGDSTSDGGLAGVTVRLYEDTNQNGRIDRGEPLIATTTSDRNGNYQFAGLTDIFVVVQILVPANTSQFQYTATTPINVPLSTGVTTVDVDFGITRTVVVLYSVRGVVWDDDNGDQIKDANELRLENIGVTLYNDVNANGAIDASDVALSTITTSTTGAYEFTNINLRNVIIAPTLPSNGTFTTPSARAVSSINTDVNDVDFGIDVMSNLFQVTGVVFDDDNENGIADPGEGSLDGLPVEIYVDTDSSGTFDASFDTLVAFTQTSNGGFGFTDPNYLVDAVPSGQVFIVIVIPNDNPPFESWTATYDPDTGTANPDGVYPTVMTGDLVGVNFGINYVNLGSTSRDINTDDTLITEGSTIEDVSERLRLYPNPTAKQITINAEEFAGDVTVEVYNDRGYKIKSVIVNKVGNEIKVDVSELRSGMYYAKFISRNKVASKKFLKN